MQPKQAKRMDRHPNIMTEAKQVSVGMEVPNFVMETYDPADREFGTISLEELRKQGLWTILVFYPADFTFVCPTELADLAAKHDALQKLGAEVISVSTDTKFSHLAWQDAEKLLAHVQYPMAADPTGAVSRMFGVYDPATGLALRGTFIINPKGVLVSAEVNFYNVGRNAEELLRKMEANAYLMTHPNEACPANWQPGGKTLTPAGNLVGKVYEALQRVGPAPGGFLRGQSPTTGLACLVLHVSVPAQLLEGVFALLVLGASGAFGFVGVAQFLDDFAAPFAPSTGSGRCRDSSRCCGNARPSRWQSRAG